MSSTNKTKTWAANWPKSCNMCKTQYDPDQWENLPYVGVMLSSTMGFPTDLEHRTCLKCGNDLTQPSVSNDDVISVNP